MRPAFSSRTKRRGATALALAPALRLFFWMASDIWHPYGDLTRNWSALDPDCAGNTCHDIEWDDRRWNGCASSSPSYGAPRPCCELVHFVHAAHFGVNALPIPKGVFPLLPCQSLLALWHCA